MIADRIRSIQAVSGGGGGGFDPSQLSGLKLWLKADAGVTVDGSGNVSSWADQSGSGKDVSQADAAKRPAYVTASVFRSKPGIRFPATGDFWLRTANSDISAAHVFVAYAPYNTTADRRILGFSNADNSVANFLLASSATLSGKMQFTPTSSSVWANSSVGPTYGILNKVSFYNDSANSYLQVNGNSYTEAKHPSYPANTIATNKYFNLSQKYLSGGTLYGGPMDGLLLEVIVTDAVNSAQIQAVYDYFDAKYQPTDPYYPVTSLILNMQGTAGTAVFTDESPNAFTVTRNGDAVLVSDATFGTVASFDGSGDYLNATSDAFSFGTGDFTVEYWFKANAFGSAYRQIAGNAQSSTSMGFGISYDKIYATTLNIGYVATTALTSGQWYHFAAVRLNGILKLYLNGNLDATFSVATNLVNTVFWIGQYSATQYPYNGLIGPTRITKGVARYTANFTPPTGLFPTS